jgi:hypothetical protein
VRIWTNSLLKKENKTLALCFAERFFKSTFGKSGSKGGLTGVYPRGGFSKVGFISIYFSKSM